MADPIVHITNGIPDVGTGNITTLGQTLLDGANLTLGAVADATVAAGAAGTMNAHLRSISRDLVGGIVLQTGGNVIGAVTQSGGPWSVSGSVSITGSVTVTGTVAATQSGTWNINNIAGTITLPTGAATAAKQPNFGTAGVPSADVLTIQGATSMTPLKVDGSGVTQPISGNVGITGNVNCVQVTSPWVTSVSGNVTIVQGGNLTTRIVGNAGGIFDFASTQNVTAPGQVILTGAEFNTVPTTLTSGNASPLQMDNAANLLVNVKTGTVAATQSGVWSTRTQDGSGNSITSTGGALDINIKSGGGGGGTSSNFGAAIPAAGTGAGYSDGSNMQLARVFDGDTGAGTQYSLGVLLKTPAAGGAVDFGVSGQPLRIDPTGTTTQPVSGSVTVTQATASNLNANVSGTVTANQGGTWNINNITGTISLPTGAATSANQPTNAALGSTTSGQTGHLALGAVTTAAPTYVTAQTNALSLTTAGALRVDGSGVTQPVSGTVAVSSVGGTVTVSGTVTANIGTSGSLALESGNLASIKTDVDNLNLTQGAATAGQKGNLGFGAVTTSAPSYTTAQSSPLSLTTAGALRVDGSGVTQPVSGTFWQATQPVSIAAAVTVQQATAGNLNATVTGTVAATQSGTWTDRIVGNTGGVLDFAGQNATAPANAILIGGEFNTTPTTISSGNASPLQLDNAGNLKVNIQSGGGSGGTASTFGTSFPSSGTAVGAKDSAGVNMQPLNLDASGNLKVNVAAGGGSGGTSSTFGAAFPGTGTAAGANVVSSAPTYTAGNMNGLTMDTAGNLRVNVVAGGASGGTSSNFGSAVPSAGTAAGFSDGSNMQLGHVWDGDSGAGTQWTQGVLLKTPASGGAVDIGVSGQPLRVDPTGTTTQPVSGTVTVTQGTASNLNATVSGTVAATQSGAWNIGNVTGTVSLPTGAATSANQPTNAAIGSTTSGQTGTLAMAAVLTAAPGLTTATTAPLSMNTSGGLRVDGSGVTQPISAASLPLPTGAAQEGGNLLSIKTDVDNLNLAQGSTTSGQKGNLGLGAVTTGAPSYTTAQSSPLSLTLAGALRVDGSGVTQPVSGTFWQATQPVSGTVTVTQGTAGNLNATVVGTGTFAVQLTGATNNINNISGTVSLPTGASTAANQTNVQGVIGNATAPASMIVTGGVFNTTRPTLTNGQSAAMQVNNNGVQLVDGSTVTQPVSIAAAVTVQQSTASNLKVDLSGTAANATAIKVDGSAVTQPVSLASTTITGSVNVQSSTAPVSTMNSASAAAGVTSPMAAVFDDVTPTAITENNFGFVRMSANRNLYGTIRDAAGNERGVNVTSGNALTVDGSATTQPVSIAAAVTVAQATAANLKGQVDPLTIASWGLAGSGQNVAAPTNGMLVQGEFNTTPTTITSGNISPLQLDNAGNLLVNVKAGGGAGGTSSSFGATFPGTGTAAGANVVSSAPTYTAGNMNGLTMDTAGALRVNVVSGGAGGGAVFGPTAVGSAAANPPVLIAGTANAGATGTVQVAKVSASGLVSVDGSAVTQPVSGTFWQTTQPISAASLPLPSGAATSANQPSQAAAASTTSGQTGTMALGAVTTGAPTYATATSNFLSLTTAGALRVDNSAVTQPVSGTFWQATQPVSGTFWQATQPVSIAATVAVAGEIASGSSDSGNPQKIGGQARTTNPTAVTDGQRVNAIFDKLGKQIVVGAIRNLKGVQKTSITAATETTVVTAGAAGVFQDVYAIIVTNKSATGVFVDFKDATAGTTRMTMAAPANDTRGFTVPVDSAMVQATAANNWTATVSSAVTSIEITVLYVSNT